MNKFIELTNSDIKKPLYLNPNNIESFYARVGGRGSYIKTNHARTYYVKESPQEIMRLITPSLMSLDPSTGEVSYVKGKDQTPFLYKEGMKFEIIKPHYVFLKQREDPNLECKITNYRRIWKGMRTSTVEEVPVYTEKDNPEKQYFMFIGYDNMPMIYTSCPVAAGYLRELKK